MNPHELETFRRVLVGRLNDLYRSVRSSVHAESERDVPIPREPGDEGDWSLESQQEDLRLGLSERQVRLAQAISEAIVRMQRGTYGTCLDCGRPIELDRLMAVPWATRCAADQQARETELQAHPPSL